MTLDFLRLFQNRHVAMRRNVRQFHSGVWETAAESLESRCLLSASKVSAPVVQEAEVALEVEQAAAKPPRGVKKLTVPNVAGTYDVVTHLPGGGEIEGVLEINQKGKKLTGTLTNELQPPGKFKAKFVKDQPRATSFNADGKIQNYSLDSFLLDLQILFDLSNEEVVFLGSIFIPGGDGVEFSGTKH